MKAQRNSQIGLELFQGEHEVLFGFRFKIYLFIYLYGVLTACQKRVPDHGCEPPCAC